MVKASIKDLADENLLWNAIRHVKRKKTSGGPDGISFRNINEFWNKEKERIIGEIRGSTYRPGHVKRQPVNKTGDNKKRFLEVPNMIDRAIQYAICQLIEGDIEKNFSAGSFGFIRGRNTYDALNRCICLMDKGYEYVADIDIKAFFDNVDHQILRNRLKEIIEDKRLISLIFRFVETTVEDERGNLYLKKIGIGQGGPISPLLANITLDVLDKQLECRGYEFVRYADDIVVLCKTQSDAVRAMYTVREILNNDLNLRLNNDKTSITTASKLEYLGYSFVKKDGSYKLALSGKAQEKWHRGFMKNIQRSGCDSEWFDRIGSFNRGWLNYYGKADPEQLKNIADVADITELNEIYERTLEQNSHIRENRRLESIFESKGFILMSDWLPLIIRGKP